jgi:drug/metabolite transporter (DMT)-like permease
LAVNAALMTEKIPAHRRQGLLELHAAIPLLGLVGLFPKLLPFSPIVIVFGRAAFASLAMLPVVLWSHRSATAKRKWPSRWAAFSGVLLALHWIAFFQAIQVSTVAVGLLTFTSFPLFVTLLEPWFFRERRRWLDLFTAVLVVAGLVLVIPDFDLSNHITQGAAWGVFSGLLYAVLCIQNRKLLTRESAMTLTWGQHVTVSIVSLPAVVWIGVVPTLGQVFLLAVLGVVCTALAHYLFIRGLSFVRAQLASVVLALESVYSIVLAIFLLGEVPSVRVAFGGAVILTAVVVATLGRHREANV